MQMSQTNTLQVKINSQILTQNKLLSPILLYPYPTSSVTIQEVFSLRDSLLQVA